MEIPELYRYGREQYWFGIKTFAIYVFDAIYQVCSYLITNDRSQSINLFFDSHQSSSSSYFMDTSPRPQDQMATMLRSTNSQRFVISTF